MHHCAPTLLSIMQYEAESNELKGKNEDYLERSRSTAFTRFLIAHKFVSVPCFKGLAYASRSGLDGRTWDSQ